MLLPSHVYSGGIESPSSKAADEISIVAINELLGSNSGSLSLPEPQPVSEIAVASTTATNKNNRI